MLEHARQLLVLLTALACLVQSQECPYMSSCTCSGYDVRCYNFQSIPPLETDPNVATCTTLEFDGGNISSVPKASLPPDLVSLSFAGHPFTDISDDAFDNSATTLRLLTILGAKFTQLPRALTKLTTLTSLKISNTPLEVLNISVMQQVSKSLRSLTLRNTSLSAWPNLTYFPLLQDIDFQNNVLNSIPDALFYLRRNSNS